MIPYPESKMQAKNMISTAEKRQIPEPLKGNRSGGYPQKG